MILTVSSQTNRLLRWIHGWNMKRRHIAQDIRSYLRKRRRAHFPVALPFISFRGDDIASKEGQCLVRWLREPRAVASDFLQHVSAYYSTAYGNAMSHLYCGGVGQNDKRLVEWIQESDLGR